METFVAFLNNQDSNPLAVRFVTWIIAKEQYQPAGKPLVFWLENRFADLRSAVAEALGSIKSETAVEPLIARLEDEDAEVRRDALGGLAQGLEKIDRKLLSCDLDGIDPFLDPREPINDTFAKRAASEFELTVEDVQVRYETLAARFGLGLAWREDNH